MANENYRSVLDGMIDRAAIEARKARLARARVAAAQASAPHAERVKALVEAQAEMEKLWAERNAEIIAQYEQAQAELAEAEEQLRSALCGYYSATGEKKFDEHLSVRVAVRLGYEIERATAWAKHNAPFILIADKKQFETIAKDRNFDFVTKTEIPQAVIATSLPVEEDAQIDEHQPSRCPLCDSPDPKKHPALQFEGEVEICKDPWHGANNAPIDAHGKIIEQGAGESLSDEVGERFRCCGAGLESGHYSDCVTAAIEQGAASRPGKWVAPDLESEQGAG